MSLESKNIIFIAPRFHTNHFFFTKHLIKNNNKVYYYVEKKIGISNNKYVKPIQINFNNFLSFRYPILNKNEFKKFDKSNTYVILRDPFYFKSIFYILFFLKYNIIFYSQVDAAKLSVLNKLIIGLYTKLFNAKWMTPVCSGVIDFNKSLFYFPFIVEFTKTLKLKSVKSKNRTFTSIGKLQKRKNLIFLVKVFKENLKTNNNSRLNIISSFHDKSGEDYLIKLKAFISSNNLSPYINLYVNVSHKMSLEILEHSDIFILPSEKEIASISILEAFSKNLPVIVADDCGNSHYVSHMKNGYVFRSNNELDLLDGMNYYSNFNNKEMEEIKRNVYESSKPLFNVDKIKLFLNYLNND